MLPKPPSGGFLRFCLPVDVITAFATKIFFKRPTGTLGARARRKMGVIRTYVRLRGDIGHIDTLPGN
jgi:hypothetical protein